MPFRSILVLLLVACANSCHAVQTDTNCRDLGFDELRLVCSDCKELETFVSDNKKLIQECFECCSPDKATVYYTSAVLEYCPIVAQNHPDVLEFIKDKAHAYPGLKVVKKAYSVPALIMKDASGVPEKLHILNWKKEQIEEFLSEKLVYNTNNKKEQ